MSGLAFGIDIAAHRAALREGLPTAAVLAHGLNTIYPAQHRTTAVEIARSEGMLLTDYRSCDPIHKGNFLARNRIVAGLVDCLIVVESAASKGVRSSPRGSPIHIRATSLLCPVASATNFRPDATNS